MGEKSGNITLEDLKKPIPIAAVVIAVISLFFTVHFQNEQNHKQEEQTRKLEEFQKDQDQKWEETNRGRIEIIKVDYINFSEIKREDIEEVSVGLTNGLSYQTEDFKLSEKISVPFAYVFWDKSKNKPLNGDFYRNKTEIRAAATKLNLKATEDLIYRLYIVKVKTKNSGITLVEQVSISTICDIQEKQKAVLGDNSKNSQLQGITYYPSTEREYSYIFYLPVNQYLEDFKFNVVIKQKGKDGQLISKTINYTGDANSFLPESEL